MCKIDEVAIIILMSKNRIMVNLIIIPPAMDNDIILGYIFFNRLIKIKINLDNPKVPILIVTLAKIIEHIPTAST